jgi:hypothetical protein
LLAMALRVRREAEPAPSAYAGEAAGRGLPNK